jgi:YD repeat-containing protein
MASIVLRRKGRYVDEDAVLVQVYDGAGNLTRGRDYDDVLSALRKVKIDPERYGSGGLQVTYDAQEIDGESAVAIVTSALRAAGIRVSRLDRHQGSARTR